MMNFGRALSNVIDILYRDAIVLGGGLLFFCHFFPPKPFYYDPPFLDFGNFENNFKIFKCDFQV